MERKHCHIVAAVEVPLFSQEQVAQLVVVVKESDPVAHDLPGWNWSIKKLRRWVKAFSSVNQPAHFEQGTARAALTSTPSRDSESGSESNTSRQQVKIIAWAG